MWDKNSRTNFFQAPWLCEWGFTSSLAALTFGSILLFPVLNAILFLVGLKDINPGYMADFGAYYTGAERFLHTGQIYSDVSLRVNRTTFVYPPITILLFVPFTVLPLKFAFFAWVVTSTVVLYSGVLLLLHVYGLELNRYRSIMVFALLVGYSPNWYWTQQGQITGLLTGLFCIIGALLASSSPKSQYLSGVINCFPIIPKPYLGASLGHLLQNRKRFLGTALTFSFMIGLSFLLLGIEPHRRYVHVLKWGLSSYDQVAPPGQWNAAMYQPLYLFGDAMWPIRLLILGMLAGVSFYFRNISRPEVQQQLFALSILTVLLTSPSIAVIKLTYAIPPIIIISAHEFQASEGLLTIPLAALLLIQTHSYTIELLAKQGPRVFGALSNISPLIPVLQPALWGVLLLVGLLLFRLWIQNSKKISLI